MSKHTPGPWEVNHDCENIEDGKLSVETKGGAKPDGYYIAQVDGGAASEANARLISAAPDLLEALEFVMSAHGEQLDAAFAQAQAAIAKARSN